MSTRALRESGAAAFSVLVLMVILAVPALAVLAGARHMALEHGVAVARQVGLAITQTREVALREHQSVRLVLQHDEGWRERLVAGGPGRSARWDDDAGDAVRLPQGYRIASALPPDLADRGMDPRSVPAEITFRDDGGTTAVDIVVTGPLWAHRIRLSASGQWSLATAPRVEDQK